MYVRDVSVKQDIPKKPDVTVNIHSKLDRYLKAKGLRVPMSFDGKYLEIDDTGLSDADVLDIRNKIIELGG